MNAEKLTVRWQAPPRTYKDDAEDIVDALRDHPGKWARVVESMSFSHAVDWRMALWEKDGNLEVRIARTDSNPLAAIWEPLKRYDVYARSVKGGSQ